MVHVPSQRAHVDALLAAAAADATSTGVTASVEINGMSRLRRSTNTTSPSTTVSANAPHHGPIAIPAGSQTTPGQPNLIHSSAANTTNASTHKSVGPHWANTLRSSRPPSQDKSQHSQASHGLSLGLLPLRPPLPPGRSQPPPPLPPGRSQPPQSQSPRCPLARRRLGVEPRNAIIRRCTSPHRRSRLRSTASPRCNPYIAIAR